MTFISSQLVELVYPMNARDVVREVKVDSNEDDMDAVVVEGGRDFEYAADFDLVREMKSLLPKGLLGSSLIELLSESRVIYSTLF